MAGAARERFRREAQELAEREALAEIAFAYRLVPIERIEAPPPSRGRGWGEGAVADSFSGHSAVTTLSPPPLPSRERGLLHIGGEALDAARLLPESGTLTALACGVCTIGSRLERRVSALFVERKMSLALALDALGNELLRIAVRRLQDRMLADARRQGLSMAGELRPGDPGLALAAQPAVLRLAGAESIGVSVTSGLALDPLKSASMVLGVGIDLPPARWSRCDDCPTAPRCGMAREPA